ncbi:hypothetical protein [Bacillus sp. OAE603]|uniref:hypothetical protein n=1 Tax=Gottfriedia sp. OAE603 TaxID=2663872 RepID=UPI00178A23E6
MSNITLFAIGAILLSVIDYSMFHFESKGWKWLKKRTKIQKVGLYSTVFIVLILLNYVTS